MIHTRRYMVIRRRCCIYQAIIILLDIIKVLEKAEGATDTNCATEKRLIIKIYCAYTTLQNYYFPEFQCTMKLSHSADPTAHPKPSIKICL
ncbi:uncharacterized protein MELLADRAFT_71609 [Melampsora larici-populina 98AG31]|uniref:Uncharacterized protein n=1 Tax=Melampsora larici-populina (strain 98AG31 / pathotype 3-4-7) TaxID=747676 RepID=F4RIJ4_MELLP|nr:uncharacterized protein MELLADRAFT_71609 [Melampsora larici-populina 98AG31]EGG07825.1 hypothetical protein MELLADRAFT_71609 [Melampsora larici-populina 98AG31]